MTALVDINNLKDNGELNTLCKIWQQAEQEYKTAKTSLDNSLEYIVSKEALKQARFNFDRACREYILEHVLNGASENVHECADV